MQGVDDRDWEQMVLMAMRYAIGRQSYANGIARDYAMRHLDEFSQGTLNVIRKDIDREMQPYGLLIDAPPDIRKDWAALLAIVEMEYERRYGTIGG